jgi:hypothetical protein
MHFQVTFANYLHLPKVFMKQIYHFEPSHHYASKAFLRDDEAIAIIMNHFLGMVIL